MRGERHVNIPIFIPHMGCKNQCVFCNQRTISGVKEFDINSLKKTVDEVLLGVDEKTDCEIAFFGGSFTGIDRGLMTELLEIANEYIRDGRVSSVRCSTRPDYIDDAVLDILERYGVKTIELGLQSAVDSVLFDAKRGHTHIDEVRAAQLILKRGFTLGGQMMIGLPGSTPEMEIFTAREIARLGCTEARIYPTLVFSGTELYDMAISGRYMPLSLEEAVWRSANALEVLLPNGIKLLRIGLCESEGLHEGGGFFAGPNHPAIGEMVFSELFYKKITDELNKKDIPNGSDIVIYCVKGQTSKVLGHKGSNRQRLALERNVKISKVIEFFASGYDLSIVARKGR